MDKSCTFLELPLDRSLYKPKRFSKDEKKPPLRVLITEAGTKAAHHLMYKICSGQVFGPDQPIIIHLVNAKGSVNHRTTVLDLEECGFPTFADSVLSAVPEKSYGKVDIVVFFAMFEEVSGHSKSSSLLCQLTKARNVARNMRMYAKPNAKLIVCSPSTKGVMVLLSCMRHLDPKLNTNNITGVVLLDEIIARHKTAAQVRVRADRVKNIVIWGATIPDLHNASAFMYPAGDTAALEKEQIPMSEALENHKWIHCDLIPSLYKRELNSHFIKCGGALASAAARHLKILFQGTDEQDEIVSMGVIIPPSEPFGFTKGLGLSVPVTTKNGQVTIRQDVEYDISTHVMNLRCLYNLQYDSSMRWVIGIIEYIKDYEESSNKEFLWNQHTYLTKVFNDSAYYLKYIISPRHDENANVDDVTSKKSITWDENVLAKNFEKNNVKSILRFNIGKEN